MERDGFGPAAFHRLHDAVERLVGCIGFWSDRKIDGRLRQRLVAFRDSQEVDRLLGGDGLTNGRADGG